MDYIFVYIFLGALVGMLILISLVTYMRIQSPYSFPRITKVWHRIDLVHYKKKFLVISRKVGAFALFHGLHLAVKFYRKITWKIRHLVHRKIENLSHDAYRFPD